MTGTGEIKSDRGKRVDYPLAARASSVAALTIICVWLFVSLAGCGKTSPPAEKSALPSYGEGSREVLLFTDYFCPPCQALESELEPILDQLLARGGVKITLVDAPVHKLTPLYARYFLFSANAGKGFKSDMHARRVLFSIAKAGAVSTEEGLEAELRKQGVAFQPYDLSKVFAAMNETMKTHDIRSTPTCVVAYTSADLRKYSGPDEIKKGLALLLSAPNPAK
jgi:thiol-disulfide isomerase/thioredoxin